MQQRLDRADLMCGSLDILCEDDRIHVHIVERHHHNACPVKLPRPSQNRRPEQKVRSRRPGTLRRHKDVASDRSRKLRHVERIPVLRALERCANVTGTDDS